MEIIKELGHGMFGTVYKIIDNNNYYAMKIEHILEDDKIETTKSSQWREIYFAEKINKMYPDQFIKLYDYKFIDNCDHVQKYTNNINFIPKYWKNKLIKLSKSKLCIQKIYELVDGNLQDIIDKLDDKQKYSMLAQIAYIINILEKNKYIHGDIHIGNIGYIKTNKKYIKISNKLLPTFGYIYKAIDYGSIMHPSYKLSKQDKQTYKYLYKKEFMTIVQTVMTNKQNFFSFTDKNNIKLVYKNDLKKIIKSNLYNIIKEYTLNKDYIFNLAELLYPDIFQKIILGNKFKNKIPIKIYFDISDFIYFFSVNLNINKIINYCFIKLNK